MERTVPRTDSDEIDLYIRTYYSLLRSTGEIQIETLVESHIGMESLLHTHAREQSPDVSALLYASLRLPTCIRSTRLIVLGQVDALFERRGYSIREWRPVAAAARRRRAYYDDIETMALLIASRSDIDDIIPVLTAYQIEWNKIHRILGTQQGQILVKALPKSGLLSEEELETMAAALGIAIDDIERLCTAWGTETTAILQAISEQKKSFSLRLLAGSLADYRKAIYFWWRNVEDGIPQIPFDQRRVYFVSSNMHSLANLWSGYAVRHHPMLLDYVRESGHETLFEEYQDIETEAIPSNRENFLYYVLKKYLQDHGQDARADRTAQEREAGLYRVASKHGFDLDAQVVELARVQSDWLDRRICLDGIEALQHSDAVIVNIDYPLGLAAYELLVRISESASRVEGVYIMGKAATLNGRVGDMMIPNVVQDEQSDNTYMFNNAFSAADIAPYLTYGTVLDNQKSVTVRGTFLQNDRYMSVFYREGYTDIEMEAGPYLSAVYELIQPKRHPYNEIANLYAARFDIGVLHYASDTPLSKGKNLGSSNLSYRGMDPTYAASVAILRRIIGNEIAIQQEASE